MKSNVLMTISAASLAAAFAMTNQTAAQVSSASAEQESEHLRYAVTDLGTLKGGTFSEPFHMNGNGVISGVGVLPDNSQHAVLWFRKAAADLGTLGGMNSTAFGDNARDQATGEAETAQPDPNDEDFCGFGSHAICKPFVWERGVMVALPTLGGNNGGGNQITDAGTVLGFAENTTPDLGCPAPQLHEFKPVVWEHGKIKELPTIGGDLEGVATSGNDQGQIVGASGNCAAFNTNSLLNLEAVHPLLWQNGTVTDLGTLGDWSGMGGGNLAWDINNRGEVVGLSDLVFGGNETFHGFLWNKATGMRDLGTLDGDFASVANGINDRGDVVGLSVDSNFNPRAFLWRRGVMTDLNTLIPANSKLSLMLACSINGRREITGLAMTSTGELHAYRAIPIDLDK